MKTPITHTLRSNIIVAIFSIIESANRSVQNFILSKNTWRSLDLLTIYFYAICIWRRLLPSELPGKGVRLLNIYWTIHAESVHSFCLFLWFFWHYMDETMQVRNLLIHYIWFKMKWRVESGCRGIQACVNIIITEKPTNNFGTLSKFCSAAKTTRTQRIWMCIVVTNNPICRWDSIGRWLSWIWCEISESKSLYACTHTGWWSLWN